MRNYWDHALEDGTENAKRLGLDTRPSIDRYLLGYLLAQMQVYARETGRIECYKHLVSAIKNINN